ncbi:MAG: orotidine-5'-phosphate decarboxylase [Crenarchaeota archaeon]|nr:orotidine-5'-phosphate decarboxylase [Thermoproteota archaeon]MDW8033553.1 orotidine-5'-phosphate decarboxylase [Nitrososphaerota archaeon]
MFESMFRRRILDNSLGKKSRIVLAFDEYGESNSVLERLNWVCEHLGEHLACIKIGYPTILSTGLSELRKIIFRFRDENLFMADVKMADVAHTNSLIARILYETGFDAVISHGFIGYKGGLEGVFKEAKELNRGVVIVVSMSHIGSTEFIDPNMEKLVQIALKHHADGAVAPATRTQVVKRVREIVGNKLLIFTPGVGAQGADYGSGISAGADFEIIGRSIMCSSNPVEAVLEVKKKHDRILSCRAC